MNIDETIEKFRESTFLEGYNINPGFLYASAVRASELSDGQLAFQKEFLDRYTQINTSPLKETELLDLDYARFVVEEEISVRNDILNKFHWPYINAPYFTISEIADYK